MLLEEYKGPTPGKSVPHPLPERLDGLERMIDVCSGPEQTALVALCGYAGLRISEALAMRTSWLDVPDRMLRVRGKGDKERFVPLSDRAWTAIASAYIRAASSPNGKLINYQDRSARKAVTALGRKAGLSRRVASHDLRATYATILSENGVNQRTIQELLGHANGATTEIYIGVSLNAMRSAVDF